MSQETAPDQSLTAEAESHRNTAGGTDAAPPRGLLQQMEELLAAVTADLAGLDADLRSSGDRDAASTVDPGGTPA